MYCITINSRVTRDWQLLGRQAVTLPTVTAHIIVLRSDLSDESSSADSEGRISELS